jgi:hypothetical protein
MEFGMDLLGTLLVFVVPLIVLAAVALWFLERGSNGG